MSTYQFDKAFGTTYRRGPMRWAQLILATVFMAPTGVYAQGEKPKTEIAKPAAATGKAQVEEAIAAKAAKLSLSDKKKRSESMLSDMRKARLHVLDLLNEARSSKDIMRLNCVNEKLTQIKGLLKIGEKASLKMFEAVAKAKPDEKSINFQYSTLAVAYQRTLVRRSEADKCVGEATVYSGDTEVEVTVEEGAGLDSSDPTVPPPPLTVPVTPAAASGS